VRSVHRFCYWKAKILSLCFVFELLVAVNDTNLRLVTQKHMNQFRLCSCRAKKCFVLLSTVQTYLRVGLCVKWRTFLSDFNQNLSFHTDFRWSTRYNISPKSDGRELRWYMQSDRQVLRSSLALSAVCGKAPNNSWMLLGVIVYLQEVFKHPWCLFMAYLHCYLNGPLEVLEQESN